MKNTIKSTVSILLAVVFLFCFVSCSTVEKTGLWESATYRRDKTFGNGEKTCVVEVKAEDQVVTFTIKTDKNTLGEALLEHELIAGEQGAYGLYVKTVNGMFADEKDGCYWILYINGEYAMTGVDSTEITEGTVYQLAYTKW